MLGLDQGGLGSETCANLSWAQGSGVKARQLGLSSRSEAWLPSQE